VRLLEERVLLVYDPLTASQTTLMQHIFEGTSAPFGLLIPSPHAARIVLPSERLQRAIQKRLHPRGRVRRVLELEYVSSLSGCALREVGDGRGVESQSKRPSPARARPTSLGSAAEPIHDWLLKNGFTLSPAQSSWLSELRSRGWSILGIVVQPPSSGPGPPPQLRGPVLALSHQANQPGYPGGHPSFSIMGGGEKSLLEIAVLTEWAVQLDSDPSLKPFYANSISAKEIARISSESGGLPWAFRRAGTLSAFQVQRPTDLGVLHFRRSDPRPSIRPKPQVQQRVHHLRIPIELLLLIFTLGIWLWLRFGRRKRGDSRLM